MNNLEKRPSVDRHGWRTVPNKLLFMNFTLVSVCIYFQRCLTVLGHDSLTVNDKLMLLAVHMIELSGSCVVARLYLCRTA